MTPAVMIGDSGMHGSMDGGRLPYPPYAILSHEQGLWDFTDDYSHGGASFAGVLSRNATERENSGMPNGITLRELVATNPAHGYLIALGGNDDCTFPDRLVNNIMEMAMTIHAAGKVCAFIGIPDINVRESFEHTGGQMGPFVNYIKAAANVAHNADIVRQTCVMMDYPYIDVRNAVQVDFRNITGDYVHPRQAYTIAIYQHVARCLVAAY